MIKLVCGLVLFSHVVRRAAARAGELLCNVLLTHHASGCAPGGLLLLPPRVARVVAAILGGHCSAVPSLAPPFSHRPPPRPRCACVPESHRAARLAEPILRREPRVRRRKQLSPALLERLLSGTLRAFVHAPSAPSQTGSPPAEDLSGCLADVTKSPYNCPAAVLDDAHGQRRLRIHRRAGGQAVSPRTSPGLRTTLRLYEPATDSAPPPVTFSLLPSPPRPLAVEERFFVSVVMMLGGFVQAIVVGNIALLVQNIDATAAKYRTQAESIRSTAKYLELSESTQDRIHVRGPPPRHLFARAWCAPSRRRAPAATRRAPAGVLRFHDGAPRRLAAAHVPLSSSLRHLTPSPRAPTNLSIPLRRWPRTPGGTGCKICASCQKSFTRISSSRCTARAPSVTNFRC